LIIVCEGFPIRAKDAERNTTDDRQSDDDCDDVVDLRELLPASAAG
jgi:hypothetical protein